MLAEIKLKAQIMNKIKKFFLPLGRHFKRHLWLYLGLIIAIVCLILFATKQLDKKSSEQEKGQQTLIAVTSQDLTENVEVSGSISSANYTTVQTQAIGTIKEIYVQEGQEVKAGDKLFELELTPEGKQANQSAYSNYLQAKNSLQSAQNQLNSLQVTLFDKNKYFIDHADKENLSHEDPDWIMQWADWLAAEGSYKNQSQVITQASANVNSAYQTYLNTGAVVYAPVSGTIENITAVEGLSFGSVSSGSGISLSDRLATIKTGNQILAIFNVSATDILKIELNQPVTISGNNLPHEYTGRIVSVDRYGTTGTTTNYQVIARFDAQENSDTDQLLPNMNVDGNITISQIQNALTIPTITISKKGDQSTVQVQKADGSIETRTIETGITSDNLTQVISGLSEGEQVVFDLPEFSSNQNSNRGSMGGMGGMGGAPPAGGSGGSGPRP